jgi:lipooligosaccharide transport system permease protein
LVVEGHIAWYLKNWQVSIVSSVLQPLLALVAFGVFFGKLAKGGAGLAAITGGVEYLVYLTPGLLCAAALMSATIESTFPVHAGFMWQKNYEAITATPVSPIQLALGQTSWVALRVLGGGAVYLAVAGAFGGVDSPRVLIGLLVSVLTGLAFSTPIAALAASIKRDNAFNVIFRFVVVPMMLFAGTYFPIDRLPEWAQVVAVVTPLWHGTELARSATLGTWELLPSLGHLAYLLAWLATGITLVCWRFRVRLHK